MKRFLNLVVYILTIHVSALLIAGLFRLVLFISSYHQLTSEALSDKTLPMLAFAHGVWFDNVIGCYILLLPLVVAVVCGVCNYYGKALFRFFTIFFSVFYGLVYLISASDIPYFAYFFHIRMVRLCGNYRRNDIGGKCLLSVHRIIPSLSGRIRSLAYLSGALFPSS